MNRKKDNLRKKILALRRSQSVTQIEVASSLIQRRILSLPLFKNAEAILFYLALKDEVQTEELIRKALSLSKRVAVPLVDSERRQILPSWIKDLDRELTVGFRGIPEPKKSCVRTLDPRELDLVIVPGIVFDPGGHRLGFGGGFYDRFLARVSGITSLSLAFEFQVIDQVPYQGHDIAVDYIITEKRIIACSHFGSTPSRKGLIEHKEETNVSGKTS